MYYELFRHTLLQPPSSASSATKKKLNYNLPPGLCFSEAHIVRQLLLTYFFCIHFLQVIPISVQCLVQPNRKLSKLPRTTEVTKYIIQNDCIQPYRKPGHSVLLIKRGKAERGLAHRDPGCHTFFRSTDLPHSSYHCSIRE